MWLLGLLSLFMGIIVLPRLIDFAELFFSNLTVKKIVGAILLLGGLGIFGISQNSMNPDKYILFGVLSLLISGVGVVVIYYDMARDRVYGKGQHDKLETLNRAFKSPSDRPLKGWHIDNTDEEQD